MSNTLLIIVTMAYSYLVGSIPTAYLVGRLAKGIDIREYGDGPDAGAPFLGRLAALPVWVPVQSGVFHQGQPRHSAPEPLPQ